MKDTQKRFIGAVLAAGSVAGIVAPSVTAMATVVEDENKATAEDLKAVIAEYTTKLEENTIFANYHRVQYAAERLAQYDEAASQEALANIAKYADKVFTAEVKTIVDKMDGFATSKSMASYDELVTKDIKAMENKENAEYLMGRLDVWGKAVVFEVDPNYVKATDAIMEVANLVKAGKYDDAEKQVVVAKDAIKAIKTYEVNGAYLEGKLKIEENILAEKANLKVVSAEAINAKEVKVVFNRELDEDSAENAANYTLYVGKDENGAKKTVEASLQDDNKTVLLQLADADVITNGQSYKVEAKNVLDVNGKKVEAYKGDFVIFNDKTAPALVATEYTGSTVKFTFDEPLKDMPTVKIDNTTITYDKTKAFSTDAGEYELTVSLKDAPQKVKDYGKHIVKLSGAKDYADNTADMITTEYTATEENEKPVVELIEDDSQDTFKVTFNTDVEMLDETNFEVKKGNHKFEDLNVIRKDDKKDEFLVTVTGDDNNKLYEDGEKSVELSIKVKDFKGKVTLEKDEDAPEVKSEDLNRVEQTLDNNGNVIDEYLVVLFNEDLMSNTTDKDGKLVKNVDDKKITVIKDGVRYDVDSADAKDKKLKVNIGKITTGEYKITIEKGAVKDTAGNKNEAVTTTLNYVNDNEDKKEFKGEIKATPNTNLNKNVITVNFADKTGTDKNKMTNSALDLSNYMIDGVKLSDSMFAGTTIAFTDETTKNEVEITLARGTVDETGFKTVKLSKDLTNERGEYIADKDDKEAKDDVKLTDDTNPEIDKIEFVKAKSADTTSHTLKVTFTEKVEIINKDKAIKDFKVKTGSNDIDVVKVENGADEDTLIITLKKDVNTNKDNVTIKVTEDKDDNNGETSVKDQSALLNKIEATDAMTIKDSIVENGLINNAVTVKVTTGDAIVDSDKIVVGNVLTVSKEATSVKLEKDNVEISTDVAALKAGYTFAEAGTYKLTVTDMFGQTVKTFVVK